jgi:hypothetical protein
MLKDLNGNVLPKLMECAILEMFEKNAKSRHAFTLRERRKVRDRYSENYRMFCSHDLDIQAVLLDSLSRPITRF